MVRKKGFWGELKENIMMKVSGILWFAFAALMFWLLLQFLYLFYGFSLLEWFKTVPFLYPFFSYVYSEIASKTLLGVFYLFSISSFFLFPVPLEALFFSYIKGFDPVLFFMISTLGLYVGQIINYLLGRYFGFVFRHFFKRKTKRSIKGKISKYGGWAIVIVESLPLPFQLFNFFAGVFKFKFKKFLFFSLLGLVIKNLILLMIYFYLF